MSREQSDTAAFQDRLAQLERAFIEEFLLLRGYDRSTVNTLPDPQRHRVLADASTYAANKLAEVESRAHYVHDIHGTAQKRGE